MNEELENETPINEDEQDITPETESNEELDKANKAYDSQKVRAEKAERELKDLKAKVEEEAPKSEKKEDKSDEPDSNDRLDRLSLKSEGITNKDDQDLVLKEAKRLSLSVEDILEEDYMKGKLKTLSTQRAAEEGMPEGGGKKGGGAKNSVDYWVNKTNKEGGYENPPNDPELTIKVVNARMDKERRSQEFPD